MRTLYNKNTTLIQKHGISEAACFLRAVETEHADLGAVIETERDVAQDHFVADGDKTPHFVHGVDDEGFVCHSGVILSESGE